MEKYLEHERFVHAYEPITKTFCSICGDSASFTTTNKKYYQFLCNKCYAKRLTEINESDRQLLREWGVD